MMLMLTSHFAYRHHVRSFLKLRPSVRSPLPPACTTRRMLRPFPPTALAAPDARWGPHYSSSFPSTSSETGSTSSPRSDTDARTEARAEQRRVCLTCQSNCSLRPGECALRGKKAHKRPKTEILLLRTQVQELETQLAKWRKLGAVQLKSSMNGALVEIGSKGRESAKMWRREAVAEYKRLEAAQDLNRKLKRELEGITTVHEAFGEFFNQQLAEDDLEMLAEIEEQNSANDTRAEDRAQFYSDLWLNLEQLYARTSEIVAAMALRDTRFEFHTVLVDLDPMVGRTHDYISNMPLSCDFRHVEYMLWRHILEDMKAESKHLRRQFLTFPPNASADDFADKQLGILLSNDSIAGETPVEGMHTLRKFVEPHRTVFVLSSRFEFADTGLEIREQGWVVISDASWTDGMTRHHRSLLQLHFRVFAVNTEPSVERTGMECLEESMLALQIDKMRDRQSRAHVSLFGEFSPPASM